MTRRVRRSRGPEPDFNPNRESRLCFRRIRPKAAPQPGSHSWQCCEITTQRHTRIAASGLSKSAKV